MKIQLTRLSSRGVDRLRETLEATNSLGRIVSPLVALESGVVEAVLPEVRLPHVYDFDVAIFPRSEQPAVSPSGARVERVESTEGAVSKRVFAMLQADPHYLLTSESYLLRTGDLERASHLPGRTLTCGEFVYHLATGRDRHDDVAAVVRKAFSVPLGFAIVSRVPSGSVAPIESDALSTSMLVAMAQSTVCILVGAYDGESVLVWTREGFARIDGIT